MKVNEVILDFYFWPLFLCGRILFGCAHRQSYGKLSD